MNQEQIMQIQIIEQEANQLNQQSELIEQNIKEMQELDMSLHEIENSENKEILANLGKRIYIPVEIKEKKLIVEVGSKNFVKKTIPETQKIIEEQIKRLIRAKLEISERVEDLQKQMISMLQEIEERQEKDKKD